MAGTSDRWSQNPLQTTASSNNMDWMKANQKDYSKFRYFLSGVDVTRQNLSMFTPVCLSITCPCSWKSFSLN